MPDFSSLMRGSSAMEMRAPMELRGSGPISGPIGGGGVRFAAGALIPTGMIGFLIVYEKLFFGEALEEAFSVMAKSI